MSSRSTAIHNLSKSIGIATMAALLVTAAALFLMPRSSPSDRPDASIEGLGFNAILEGTVVESPSESRFSEYTAWTVRIDKVLYDRGAYFSLARGEFATQPVPSIDDTVTISVLDSIDLRIGDSYAFYAGRAFFPEPEEQARWPWQSDLVLVPGDGYRPANGVDVSLAESLDKAQFGKESPLDALVGFATEYAEFLDQRNQGDSPLQGERLAAVVGVPAEVEHPAHQWLTTMSRRPADQRQLPTDQADLAEFDAVGVSDAFGVTDWTPWLIVVLLDDSARGTTSWFGAYIQGVGYLGPVGIEPGDVVVELDGYGPPNGSIQILRWTSGTPAETLLDAARTEDAIFATKDPAVLTIDAESLSEDRGTEDVLLIVDLRNGVSTTRLVSLTEMNKVLVEIVGETEPGPEPRPETP